MVENLADAIDNGSRDQHSDALVNELNNHFEKCQQLLNSIAASINSKSMVNYLLFLLCFLLIEYLHLIFFNSRDLIAKYRSSVEDLLKTEP
ncbi:hypothetical protein Goarm_008690 [Gossypium armourianum]|uniref:Uncharacterized protein n=1 Tax=Gossypium armourianum TaxID=34283 RepID=A0A7J9JQL1_9ROSI|nr:hypothetical protein [Gossypium armourianum]